MADDSDDPQNPNYTGPRKRYQPPRDKPAPTRAEFAASRYLGGYKKPRPEAHLSAAADVLQGLLQNSKSQLADGFQRWRLEHDWQAIVGETIAEQTQPAAFDKGTLWVWVRHSAWMQQLWYFQDAIKDKVNAHLGKAWVTQVKFTLNRRAATTTPGEKAP